MPPAPRLSLARTTLASLIADAVLALSSLAAIPYMVGHLGVEQYGIFALITVLAGQLVGLHLGIGWAATRRLAETRTRGGPGAREATLRAVLLLSLGASLLVAAAFAVVATLAWTRAFRGSAEVLRAALATVPAGVVIAAMQPALHGIHGILYGEERFLLVVGLRLVHGVGRVGAAVAAVALGGGVVATLWSQAALDLLVVLAAVAAIAVKTGARPATSLAGEARVLLLLGVPFAVAGVFAALLADVEKLAIGMARSVEDFTYYSVPFNVTLRLGVFAVALASVLAARLSSLKAAEDMAGAAALARRARRISLAGMALVVAPVVAVVPELLRLWVGADFAARSTLLTRILLVALLPRTLAYITESVLRATARPVTFTILYALELPLHLVAVYLLVRGWGVQGAAVAWLLRVAVDAAAQWVMAGRALGASLGRAVEILGPPVALGLLAAACQALDAVTSPWLRLAAGLGLGVALVLRLLSREDWGVLRRMLWPETPAEAGSPSR